MLNRSRVLLTALFALAASPAGAQEAPFGLSWGLVTAVPRPAKVDREGNITALYYRQGMPPAAGPDTLQVILEVCRDEGLQQVLWSSRDLAAAEAAQTYDRIYAEGVRRFGRPETGLRPGTVVWGTGRTLLASLEREGGYKQLVMLMRGDQYDRCSAAHELATGHPANRHALELIEP